jgi:O-antigen ligase
MSFASATSRRPASPHVALRAGVVLGVMLTASQVFLCEAVFRESDAAEYAVDWQVALRMVICGCCGLYGAYFLPQTIGRLWSFPGFLIVLFGLWATATVPTAIDMKHSAAAVVALWCVILFAPAALQQLGPRLFVLTLIASLVFFLAVSWYAYYALPEFGRTVQTTTGGELVVRFGGLSHPNTLARLAALLIGLLLLSAVRYGLAWRWVVPLLAIALFTIPLTDSRTGMIAAALAALVALRGKLTWLFRPAVFCSLLAAGLGAALLAVAADLVHFDLDQTLGGIARSGDASEIYSLTGRTEVWRFALGNIAQSPLFGFGYGCSRFVMVENFFATHHAHNLLLNVGLNAGLIGSLLIAWMLAILLWRSIAAPSGMPDVVALLVLVCGITDFVMLGPIPDSHTLLFFVALLWGFPAESDRRPAPEGQCDLNGIRG